MTPETLAKRRAYTTGWRKRNQIRARVYQQAYNIRRTHSRQLVIWKHKNVPCADCRKRYPPYVMDFDHVRGIKTTCVGRLLSQSIKKIEEEIAKCEVVCGNCHRERTHRRKLIAEGWKGKRYKK